MAEAQSKKEEKNAGKDFGEGIEVVKAEPQEEKDVEINFGRILSFFKQKPEETEAAKSPLRIGSSRHKSASSGLYNPAKQDLQLPTEQSGNSPIRSADAEKEAAEHKTEHGRDDEGEIDVGKLVSGIKGIFKGVKEANPNRAKARLGPVPKADLGTESAEGEDVSLNPQAAVEFLKKRGMLILLITGILIAMGITANVRTQVAALPFTYEWAQNSVYNTIQSDISSAISQQYPNLPEARKNQILSDELAKARKSKTYTFKTGQYTGQTINIQDQVKSTAEFIKGFYKDENGKPYSPDIDPYYWYRYAKNIVETGHIGDEVKNGLEWDNHQVAPFGRQILPEDTFFPYLIAYLYKTVKFFNHAATLWEVQTNVYPALLSALTVLLIFLIGRKIAGNVAGFFGSLMAGLHAAFVNRTIHGDNDAAVMFFAILTLWLFVEAIYANKTIKRLALAALAGLAAAVFSIGWGGWWFVLVFIITASAATVAAGALNSFISSLTKGRRVAEAAIDGIKAATIGTVGKLVTIPTAVFLIATAFFVGIFTSFDRIIQLPRIIFGISHLKSAVLSQSYWPNVLTTVAELNEGSLQQVISQIKPGIFWLSLLSAALLVALAAIHFMLPLMKNQTSQKLRQHFQPKEENALYSIFFATLVSVWFIGTIYASTKGIRFVLLLAPMAGLGFGMTLGLIFKTATWTNENFLKINKVATAAAIFAVLAMAAYSTDVIKDAYNVAKHDTPIMNDAWYSSLTAIKEDSNSTTKDATITSWWDFGHHFKAITDRRVTFDGTTQQGPQAHWVGKLFMISSETEAAGILRMLDCGSNTAFDALNSVKNDYPNSTKIIYRMTQTPSKNEADKALTQEYGLNAEQAANVTKYTHCERPPEGYVIASEDMIGKSGVWGHFGSWDLEKAVIWQTMRSKSEKEAVTEMRDMFNYSDEKAKSVYNELRRIKDDREANTWIAPWPSFSSDVSGCQTLANPENEQERILVRCGNGLAVNLTTYDAYFQAQDGSVLHPISLVYLSNETGTQQVVEKIFTNNTVPQRLSTILIPQGNSYASILASPELAGGMFTKMFFFGGTGLKHFKLLTHQTGLTGTSVYVYKADWDSLR
ncbi:glycosyltransferase family 39 protein [Candidatus Woesearchaeota archaeon]|nr:glycosyltransferase family 39 protein [Candidatus Woesearchaeota archaeon]